MESSGILSLLQGTHTKELLPERKIVSVAGSATVAEALQLLTKHNILSMPVWDSSKQQFSGMIDMEDILTLFLSTLTTEPTLPEVEWKFAQVPISTALNFSHSDVFLPMEGEHSVWHLIEVFTRGVHRIPVLDENGSIVNIVSQSSVVKFLDKHIDSLGVSGQKTLRQIHVIQDHPSTVRKDMKAVLAFRELHQAGVADAIALVDNESKFCGSLSDCDLRGLGYELFTRLQLPVNKFVEVQEHGHRVPLTEQCCTDDVTLEAAIQRMAKYGLHRLWIVDHDHKPVGIVSLLDVMKALMLVSHSSSFHEWQKKVVALAHQESAPGDTPGV